MPGQEPSHHWQRGALIPLGPALNWLQKQPTAGLAGPGSSFWLLRLAEPVLVLGILQCVLTEPSNYGNPMLFQAGNICQFEAMFE